MVGRSYLRPARDTEPRSALGRLRTLRPIPRDPSTIVGRTRYPAPMPKSRLELRAFRFVALAYVAAPLPGLTAYWLVLIVPSYSRP